MTSIRAIAAGLRRHWRRVTAVFLVVLLLGAGGGVYYFSQGFHGRAASIEQVRANENVDLEPAHGGYVLSPANASASATVGLVFYPGARVEPDAYLVTFAPIVVATGITVSIPDLPLNVGLLGVGTAGQIQHSNPAVQRWYVGGHSLGGVAACRYASNAPDSVDGLVLFASYCDRDVSEQELAVLSITGTQDTVLDRGAYDDARGRLPADTVFHEVDGVNHSQFGSYSGQRGDSPATVSYETAHDRVATVVIEWLTANSEGPGS